MKVLCDDSMTRQEKSDYACYLISKYRDIYPECYGFHFEKDCSYFDEDVCYEYAYYIGEDEGFEGDELEAFVEAFVESEWAEHNDIGFDY